MRKTKKVLAHIFVIIMIVSNVLSTGITVNAATLSKRLYVGETAYVEEYHWVDDGITSSNPSVATATKDVVNNGQVKITGHREGNATISFRQGGSEHTINVTVYSVPVTGISFGLDTIDLAIGHTTKALVKFQPFNATNKTLAWSSADTSKVKVDPNTGVLEGIAATGDDGVVVTATTVSGAGNDNQIYRAEIKVRVGEPQTSWKKDTTHAFEDGKRYVFLSEGYAFYGLDGVMNADYVEVAGDGILANVKNQLTIWTYSASQNQFISVDGMPLDALAGFNTVQYITDGEALVFLGKCAPENNPWWIDAPHYIALENEQYIKKQDSNGYSGQSYPSQYRFTVYKEISSKTNLSAEFFLADSVEKVKNGDVSKIGTATSPRNTAEGMRYDTPWYNNASWYSTHSDRAIAAVSVNGTLYSGPQLSNFKIYPGIDTDIKYYFYENNTVTVNAEFYFIDSVGVITDEHLSTPGPQSHHYLGSVGLQLDRKTTENLLDKPLEIFQTTQEQKEYAEIYNELKQKEALDYLYEVRSSHTIMSGDTQHIRQWIYASIRSNANNYKQAETHLHVDTENPPLNMKDTTVTLKVNELHEEQTVKFIYHKRLEVPIEYYYENGSQQELLARSYTTKENWTHICAPMLNAESITEGTGEQQINFDGAQKILTSEERRALSNRRMEFYVGDTLIKTVNGVLDRVELTEDEADKFVGSDIKLKIYYSQPTKVTLKYYLPSGYAGSPITKTETADVNNIVQIPELSKLGQNTTGLSKYNMYLCDAQGNRLREITGVPSELAITESGSEFILNIYYVKSAQVKVEYYFITKNSVGQEEETKIGEVIQDITENYEGSVSVPDFTVDEKYFDVSKMKVEKPWPIAGTDREKLVDKFIRQYDTNDNLIQTIQGVPDEVTLLGGDSTYTLKVYFVKPAVPTSNILQLPITIRDFRGDGILFEYSWDSNHPSRNYNLYGVEGAEHPNGEGTERTTGLVENELVNGKIVYKEETVRYVAQLLYAGIYNNNPFDRYTNIIGHIFDVIERGKEKSEIDAMGSMKTVNAALAVDGEVDYEDIEDAYTAAYYLLSHMWDDDGVDANADSNHPHAYKEYNMIVPRVRAIQFQQYTDGIDKYYEYNSHDYKTVLSEDGVIKNIQQAPESTPYDDLCYHPIDNLGYGNVNQDQTLVTSDADKLHNYNYLFTTMGEGQFVFSSAKNLYFEFNGDDDVYLFIDGKLVLDNGGAHQKENAIVYLNDINGEGKILQLEEGKSYDFTFFHAERRSTGSHFHIKTNIEVMDSAVLTEKHVYQDKIDQIDGNLVDKNQPVVYGFEMINHGSSHVFHLALEDESLGIRLYAKGSSKPCKFNGIADEESVKLGYATEVGQELSNEILPGNIEITITELDENNQLFYPNVVRYEFIQNENKDSTLGSWWPSYDSDNNLIVDTKMSTYGQFKETKLKDKFRELYGREGTQEEYIALLQEILLNGLEPTQRILIKRFNRIMGANETYTNRVNTFATNIVEQKIVGTASITVRTLDIENRIFVLDYGKKVHFHEDQIFTEDEMTDTWLKLDVSTNSTPDWKIISENPKVVGKFGTATLGTEDTHGRFFQYELDRYMSASEAFKIGVEPRVENSAAGTYQTRVKTITIMPASNIYYEDDFDSRVVSQTLNVMQDTEYISQSGIVYQGNWSRVRIDDEGNDVSADRYEGSVFFQEGKETIGDNPYGYDTNYNYRTTFSNDTAWVADVSDGTVARAYYEFQGNGIDIYSRTNSKTALVYVNLFQKQIDGTWKSLGNEKIDTLYKTGDLYQVPIASYNKNNMTKLRYGTYRVQLLVTSVKTSTDTDTSVRSLFYLDGIRIYNPAGTSVETEVEYAKNNEANANYTEIRDILLSAPEGDGVLKGNGAIYIDSLATEKRFDSDNPGVQIASDVKTYESFGPKNEVYLNDGKNADGQIHTGAIAFGVIYKEGMSLQVGARAPENMAGTPRMRIIVTKNSDTQNPTEQMIELQSTSDMYYKILIPEGVKPGDELTISIINTSAQDGTEIEKGDNFIALTKLKQSFDSITHTANTYSVTEETSQIATENVRTFMLARRMANKPEEEPEDSELEVSQPEEQQPVDSNLQVQEPTVSQTEVQQTEVQKTTALQSEVKQPEVPKSEETKLEVSQVETAEPEAEQTETTGVESSQKESRDNKGFFWIIWDFILEILSHIKEWLGLEGGR